MSQGMLDRRDLSVSAPPKVPTYTYTNKRTGEVQQIPMGVDPGFNYPPGGRQANLDKMLAEKVDLLPSNLKNSFTGKP